MCQAVGALGAGARGAGSESMLYFLINSVVCISGYGPKAHGCTFVICIKKSAPRCADFLFLETDLHLCADDGGTMLSMTAWDGVTPAPDCLKSHKMPCVVQILFFEKRIFTGWCRFHFLIAESAPEPDRPGPFSPYSTDTTL